MKRYLRLVHYVTLIVVTLAAGGVMWWLSSRDNGNGAVRTVVSNLPEEIGPKPRVAVRDVAPRDWPVYAVFTGKIRSWETYRIGFELAGRIAALGENADLPPLDVGDRVKAGQVIARLDDRILRARKDEMSAQLELARTEMTRARKLRERGSPAITDTEYQKRLTDLALANARFAVVEKNLEDAVLLAPVDATIAHRHYKVGESVNPHQAVFELVEDDPILLVVDVPESHIRELQARKRRVDAEAEREQIRTPPASGDTTGGDGVRAIVSLPGEDRLGRSWPLIEGEVHQIAQMASPQTGMFEVEVRLPNPDGRLREGMIATAWIEVDRLFGHRLPEAALVVRRSHSHVYIVEAESADVQALYWDVGTTTMYRAHRHTVQRFAEQRPLPNGRPSESRSLADLPSNVAEIILPAETNERMMVVVRGQHRLTDRQLVRVMNESPAAEPGNVQRSVQSTPPDEGTPRG